MLFLRQFSKFSFATLWSLALITNMFADEPSDCTWVSPSSQDYPAYVKALIEQFGGEEFRNPVSVAPTTEAGKHDIIVHLSSSRLNVKCRQNLGIRYYGANVVTSCFLECQKPGELKSR